MTSASLNYQRYLQEITEVQFQLCSWNKADLVWLQWFYMLSKFSGFISILYLILAAPKANKPLVAGWIPPEAEPEARICLSGKNSFGR